jgi:hypothetical protein
MKKQWVLGFVVLAVVLSLGMGACKVGDIGLANTKWKKTINSYDCTLEFGNSDYKMSVTYLGYTSSAKGDCEASFGNIKFIPNEGDSDSGKYTYFGDSLWLAGLKVESGSTGWNGEWKKK